MGYWPNKMKRRRHNWVTELGRKMVLLGCTGHHEMVSFRSHAAGLPINVGRKIYVLEPPALPNEDNYGRHVKGWSEDSVTVKGARMMEII